MYPSPLALVAAMSALKTVRLERTLALFMKEINGKSPPLQNAAEYRCCDILERSEGGQRTGEIV